MASLFTKIVEGQIPCHEIASDEEFLAFLDINPLREGHTLVIPKAEIDYIFDLDDDKLARLHVFAKHTAQKIERVIKCKRIGVSVIGLEVPHAHIHLVPLDSMDDLNFTRHKLSPSQDELRATAEKIRG